MPRILFFGMKGAFSKIPFEHLLHHRVEVCGVIVSANTPRADPHRLEPAPVISDLPLLTPHLSQNIIHLAWQANIPVWQVGRLNRPKTLALLQTLQPDVICVACFPYLFPKALLSLPKYGCLNLHPSLLPAYRGPSPLFWICRQGESETGVTLHWMDEGMDSGNIVQQRSFALPEGILEAELTRLCATEGAALLLETLTETLTHLTPDSLPGHPQPTEGASYFPAPSQADCRIPLTWPARRAFTFLRGANTWPLTISLGDQELAVRETLGYSPDQVLPEPYLVRQDEIWVQFNPGIVKVRGVGNLTRAKAQRPQRF